MPSLANPRVRLVTDTTACLSPEFLQAHAIENVPQVILFGEESFLEEVEISRSEFIRRLRLSPVLPKTAAPPPGEFVKAFARQLAQADTLLCLHPSTEVSGTVRSALTAREDSFAQADIRILDTRTVGGNLATMVILATAWVEQGLPPDEILARLQAMIPRGRIYFLVPTLEYLHRGGRIGGASALVGSALQIKPILQLLDGRVEALEKVRTQQRARARLIELVREQCPPSPASHLCVMHADLEVEAQHLAEELREYVGLRDVPVYPLGAAITTHGGPGTLGVGFFT
jgi:DegV family protein with EDD domain